LVETPVLFFADCGPKFIKCGRHLWELLLLQRRFPIDDIVFRSRDICNKVAKWLSWKQVFRLQNFTGEGPPKWNTESFIPPWGTSSRKVWCNSQKRPGDI